MANEKSDSDDLEGDVVRVSLLFEKPLLDGVERAAGRYGLTRSAFIRQACQKALAEVEGEPDWNELLEATRTPFYYDLASLARRIQHVGHITPKGLQVLKLKVHDKIGPAETLQMLPSPFEQLLRKLGLTRRKVEEALQRDQSVPIKTVG